MKNNNKLKFAAIVFSILTFSSSIQAKINVVASIKPIHSLVASVMDGVGEPSLIVDGNASPHTFQLKPSHAKLLQNADIIFWIDKDLENFLVKPLSSIAKKSKKISLMEINSIKKLKFREKNIFVEKHDDHKGHKEHDDHKGHKEHDDHKGHKEHDDHKGHKEHDDHKGHKEHDDHKGHKEHDDHKGHKEHDDHKGHKEHDDHKGHKEHDDHKGHKEHAHGEFDIHIWLDPENAKTMSMEIAKELSKIDPKNKLIYESNAKKVSFKINKIMKEIKKEINKDAAFVVFHDAYQYFEKRFNIDAVGALTVNPEVLPGAKQLTEIRKEIKHEKVKCLFSEPQFNPSIAKAIAKDTGVKIAVLDPLGAKLNASKDLYFQLIKNIALSFKNC
ncbi:putative zinc-binding protein [Candidatus Pelagibacter sp. IMCC9063]|uniref:metal ABC transporter solute-binding protein, Zn/Mn family n=1 Tax=Pelagibacter sp. (strain IMCC9063) TaxID=1002672 RepID=UPI0002046516|nr:zinc ABC transporter substrate-binding protein [Candidatus Pelagibacter sp. IMCC9063]AEA81843.1 putative zinc-binding protein [Candidatus Pelagibacter sp. IMCC9063]